jgi:hypothetical protein
MEVVKWHPTVMRDALTLVTDGLPTAAVVSILDLAGILASVDGW